jgi:hypothetical protein
MNLNQLFSFVEIFGSIDPRSQNRDLGHPIFSDSQMRATRPFYSPKVWIIMMKAAKPD